MWGFLLYGMGEYKITFFCEDDTMTFEASKNYCGRNLIDACEMATSKLLGQENKEENR
jgi:hypothetical protein